MFSSFLPRSEGQKRPKSEWPSNKRKRSSHQTSGHSTAEWRIGLISGVERKWSVPPVTVVLSNLILISVLATITFATTTPLTLASFNLHGFSSSSRYLNDSIQRHGGIWMVQEHWLSEQQLPRFEQLNAQFFARSGMEDAISAGVFQGRPFGGVSICWSKNLNHVVCIVAPAQD